MFSEFHDLPVHALAVHGAVVLVPLSALFAVLFAIPRTRKWAEWAFPLFTLGAMSAVFVAKQSGQKLFEHLNPPEGSPPYDAIKKHESAALTLFNVMLVFTVLAIIAFALSRMGRLDSGPLPVIVSIVLVLAAGGVAYQTYRVGELGAKAVWNPDGSVDYSSSSSPLS
jgi:hypothetical protein